MSFQYIILLRFLCIRSLHAMQVVFNVSAKLIKSKIYGMQAPSILTAYIITNHPAFITKSLIQIKNLFHESLNPESRRQSQTRLSTGYMQ